MLHRQDVTTSITVLFVNRNYRFMFENEYQQTLTKTGSGISCIVPGSFTDSNMCL